MREHREPPIYVRGLTYVSAVTYRRGMSTPTGHDISTRDGLAAFRADLADRAGTMTLDEARTIMDAAVFNHLADVREARRLLAC